MNNSMHHPKFPKLGYPMTMLVPDHDPSKPHVVITKLNINDAGARYKIMEWLIDHQVHPRDFMSNGDLANYVFAGPLLEIVSSPCYHAYAFADADIAMQFKLVFGGE